MTDKDTKAAAAAIGQVALDHFQKAIDIWEDFPETTETAVETYTYVICQQGPLEEEHLFWSNDNGWVDLDSADHFTIDEVHTHGDTPVVNGFWMGYERAVEMIEQ